MCHDEVRIFHNSFSSFFFIFVFVFAYRICILVYRRTKGQAQVFCFTMQVEYFRKVISGRCAEQRRFCSQWCDFSEATRLCQISRFLRGERFTMYEAVEESIKRENSSKALLSRVRAILLSEYYNASCHSFREYFTTVFPQMLIIVPRDEIFRSFQFNNGEGYTLTYTLIYIQSLET